MEGLTQNEITEAERLLDPQASKVNEVYQYKKKFVKEVRKIIDESDLLIEVLDARDPEGSRSHDIEKEIAEKGKKLVLLMNKIDLVSEDNSAKWFKKLSA